MKIAVTGGYGSGKSSVTSLLVDYLGAELADTDRICKDLLEKGEAGYRQLEETYGPRFILENGNVDRQALRNATFSDTSVKEQLEGILHPLVRNHVNTLGKDFVERGSSLVVEVPLLYEVGWQDDFDQTILVRVARKTSIARTVKRDSIDNEEAERILELQMPMTCKEPLADYIIDNGSTFVSTAQQTAWLATLLKTKRHIQ